MRRWRAAAASAMSLAVVAFVVISALFAEGRVGSEAVTNDGGAWLLNRGEGVIGHVNRVVGEVDTTAGPFSGQFQVTQAADVVAVDDRGASRATLVDTTQAAIGAVVTTTPTTDVIAAPGAVVLHDPAAGSVWRFAKEEFGTVQALDDEPPVVHASVGTDVGVGRDGSVLVVDAADTSLYLVRPGQTVEAIDVELWPAGDVAGVTFVGEVPVVGFANGDLLVIRDGVVVHLVTGVPVAVWQQPSFDGDSIVGITDAGGDVEDDPRVDVVTFDLESGEQTARLSIDGGEPLAPIVHAGCVWTVTLSSSPVFHHCGTSSPLPTTSRDLQLVLVNGWVWVNDVDQGGIWFVREDDVEVQEILDWTAALNLTDTEDVTDDSTGGDEELVENARADDLVDEIDQLDDDERNNPPVADDDDAHTRRGRPVVVRVLDNDTDPDGDPLTVESLVDVDAAGLTAAGALVTITPDGSAVQIVPPEDLVGEIRFGYVVHDGRQGRDDATVRVTVTEPDEATNRPPITEDDNATVRAGKSVSLNVLHNDHDPDGDVIALVHVDEADGTVNLAPDGEVTYTPDITSPEGTIELGYVVADDYGAEATGTIRIRVRSADSNQAPQARNDVGRTTVGRPVILNVLHNDYDPDGDPLIAQNLRSLDGEITNAQLTSDGQFLFRPDAPGTYRFAYTVTDGPETDDAQVRIDVEPAAENRPPIAVLDEVALAIGETRLVRVLDNDGDPDGDVISIVDWVGAPGLEISEVPGVGFNVTATPTAEPRTTFRYWISDGINAPVRGNVIVSAIRREPVDYPPVAVADTFDVRAGRTTELAVLRNDFDPEGEPLRLVGPLPELSEGLLRMSPDRQRLLLTADPDQRFSFQFAYDVEDPAGNRASAVVTIRIVDANQPNRAPVAVPDIARTTAGEPVVIPVKDNDYDPDGDPITVESIAEQPQHGTVELLPDDTIIYTPHSDFAGTDSFVYTLVDGYQAPPDSTLPADQRGPGRSLGEVFIGVLPGDSSNRPPVAVDDVGFPAVEIGAEPVVLDVLANDFDPDGDPLVVTEITEPAVGSAAVGGNGRFVLYTPPSGIEPRDVAFSYAIADGRGGTDSAQVHLELVIEPDALPPIAVDDTVGPVSPGDEVVFDPRDNDINPDGDRFDLVVLPDSELMTVEDDGRVRIAAPDATADLEYRVRSPRGLDSDTAFVTVLVAENQAPIVEPIEVETAFGEPAVIDIHDFVSDPDDDPLVITLGRQRAGGSVRVVGDSGDDYLRVEFDPDTDFVGVGSFDFTVDDRHGHTVAGNATVTVLPPENRPPDAGPITIEATAGVSTPVRLADAVTDPDGADEHRYEISGPANGHITLEGPTGGVVTVTSAVDGGGVTDSFTYTVVDGEHTASNTVTINVLVPDFPPPTVTNDTARILQGESTAPIDVLANDVDNSPAGLRGDGLVVTAVGVSPAGHVEQTGNTVVFTPDPDFFGEASFTYTVQDGRRSGAGESTGLVSVQVIGRPGQPQPPVIDTVGNEYLIVSWNSPQGDVARAPVTGYVLEYVAGNGDAGTVEFNTPTTSYRWEGLPNAVEHCFRVAAVNEAGVGQFSGQSACRAPDVRPEKPAVPTVEFGDTELTVNWTPPLNQGSEIVNYQLRISGGAQGLSPELGVTTSYVWDGLDNGTDYTFDVRAQNSASSDNEGWSDWSSLSAPEHPLTVPDAPAQPQAVRGDRQVEVTWNAPYDGGDAITRYQVRSSLGPEWVDVTPQGTVNRYVWESIPNGVDVSFEVRAINRDARSTTPGNISPPSPVVRTCSVPDAPPKPSVERGDRQVTVSWSAPDDQGCAISEYRIEGSDGRIQTAGANARSHVFTGLTNGETYTFRVAAINEVVTVDGRDPRWSPWSDEATPAGRPRATNVTSAENTGVRQVRVQWSAPDDNGSPITGYELRVNNGSWNGVGNVTTHTYNAGSDGATYTFEVRAVNNVGPSLESGATRTVTTWDRPGSPNVSASRDGDRRIAGSWSRPSNTGGTSLTGLQTRLVTGSCPSSGDSRNISSTSQAWSGLNYSTTYRVCVRYQNAVGWGNWGSATATTNAEPQPAVSAFWGGSAQGQPGCSTANCRYLHADGSNFTPGLTYSVHCEENRGSGWERFSGISSRTADSSGRIEYRNGCYYGYPDYQVRVVIGGVRSSGVSLP